MEFGGYEKSQTRHLPNLHVTTEEIKEIVQCLNSPPFSKTLTLVSFDEKTPHELLELLNDVFGYLDEKQRVDFSKNQEENLYQAVEFLKILSYPSNFDMEFQRGLLYGDKKVIYPILHFVLTQLPQMEQRAYLAKFLVSVYVPEEMLAEDDMKEVYQQYKELQAQFQATHQELEQLRQEAPPSSDLKRDIEQLETEKEQLVTKISRLKQKFAGNENFQELLEATSLLRKEQEEEAMLMEKLQEQQEQLEWSEGNLMAAQQRLLDVQKVTSSDTTALDMLNLLRNDVKRNRDFCNERIGRELNEKTKRVEQVEQLLNEPVVTQQDVDSLQNEVRKIQKEVQLLEEKASSAQNPSEDKLSVYKQQASLVSKKKEKALEKLRSLETEESKLEKKMMAKEKEYENVRGGNKFMSRDDFYRYAQGLRAKKKTFQQMKAQLKDIRAELTVLGRTEQILKGQLEEANRSIKQLERQHGIEGFSEYKDALEQVSSVKQNIDFQKGETLEEISKIVEQLDTKIKENRSRLAPLVNELRSNRTKFQELNQEYESKKAQYESVNATIQTEKAKIQEEVNQLGEETNAQDSKLLSLETNLELVEALLRRTTKEEACRKGEQKFNKEFNTLKDWYSWKIEQQLKLTQELRSKEKVIKENHKFNSQQVKMFEDLSTLLKMKAKVCNEDMGGGLRGKDLGGESGVGGVNRLVLGD